MSKIKVESIKKRSERILRRTEPLPKIDGGKKNVLERIQRPASRQWVRMNGSDEKEECPAGTFNIMCSNILSARYTSGEPVVGYNGEFFQAGEIHNRAKYGYCPDIYLDWEYRKKLCIKEIQAVNPDVACLQEVEAGQFKKFFEKKLSKLGYKGVYCARSSGIRKREGEEAKRVDGCAIFYKSSKFNLVDTEEIDFNACVKNTTEWADTSAQPLCGGNDECSQDETNEFAFEMFRILTNQGCVALCAMLEVKDSFWSTDAVSKADDSQSRPRYLQICNAHLESKFTMPDVRIVQAMVLAKKAKEMLKNYQDAQVIICGDLNALPKSGCVRYLTEGKISSDDPDFYNMPYEKLLSKMFGSPNENGCYTHDLGLVSAISQDIMPYSCLQPKFKGMLDHVLYQGKKSELFEALNGPVEEAWLKKNKIEGAPNQQMPSDHFPLAAKFLLKNGTNSDINIDETKAAKNGNDANDTQEIDESQGDEDLYI